MKTKLTLITALLVVVWALPSFAGTQQLKVYRAVYPDVKPGCVYCHLDKMPKKDDGMHDLNLYGQHLKKRMGDGELTEDIVKEAGRHDEFVAPDTEEVIDDMSDALQENQDESAMTVMGMADEAQLNSEDVMEEAELAVQEIMDTASEVIEPGTGDSTQTGAENE
ncbi:MAG: hypothetical protein KC713_04675 [Candidatus Omnitrophica bacterium]|nr:hypothetical protein [Candidatus Omnitrophota bacterium]